mgnify:CR=1 FL=1
MEISILIAKIIGIVYVSFGIGLMANKAFYKEAFSKLFENTGYLIIGGFIAIVLFVLCFSNTFYVIEKPKYYCIFFLKKKIEKSQNF